MGTIGCDRVWVEVNLDAIRTNMSQMQAHLAEGGKLAGVVKADAYGHGAVPVAYAIDPFVCMYAVATVEEGVELRRNKITKPILILGQVARSRYAEVLHYDLELPLFEVEAARQLEEEAKKQQTCAKVHLAVDTGMSRIGFAVTEEAAEEARQIAALPKLRIAGMFTHFARADERDKESARKQYEAFLHFWWLLKERGVEIPLLHCANSAAILELPEMHMDVARAGIAMYGLYPSDEMQRDAIALLPAMEWKSRVSYVKSIPAGTPISYGGTFVAEREMRIATLPFGYADGYPRSASQKEEVLIHGKRVPLLGRICMDQCMADVTELGDVKEGTLVTLVGRDGEEEITMEELAERSGGFHYELCCGVGKRVPRRYWENGRLVGVQTSLSKFVWSKTSSFCID
ncbi:MAG: alanine racemase [bacterium]|nr:alanine racemase [bacterium]